MSEAVGVLMHPRSMECSTDVFMWGQVDAAVVRVMICWSAPIIRTPLPSEEGTTEGSDSNGRVVFCSSLLLSSLELRDANVYEPYIRVLDGTTSQFCGAPGS